MKACKMTLEVLTGQLTCRCGFSQFVDSYAEAERVVERHPFDMLALDMVLGAGVHDG